LNNRNNINQPKRYTGRW